MVFSTSIASEAVGNTMAIAIAHSVSRHDILAALMIRRLTRLLANMKKDD
jgi:hypothetical protein